MGTDLPNRLTVIIGGKRCAIEPSTVLDDWWVGYSPRNGQDAFVEGPWDDWVVLARKIIHVEEGRVSWRGTEDES